MYEFLSNCWRFLVTIKNKCCSTRQKVPDSSCRLYITLIQEGYKLQEIAKENSSDKVKTDNCRQAIVKFEAARNLFPDIASSYLALGTIYFLLAQATTAAHKAKAIEYYITAVSGLRKGLGLLKPSRQHPESIIRDGIEREIKITTNYQNIILLSIQNSQIIKQSLDLDRDRDRNSNSNLVCRTNASADDKSNAESSASNRTNNSDNKTENSVSALTFQPAFAPPKNKKSRSGSGKVPFVDFDINDPVTLCTTATPPTQQLPAPVSADNKKNQPVLGDSTKPLLLVLNGVPRPLVLGQVLTVPQKIDSMRNILIWIQNKTSEESFFDKKLLNDKLQEFLSILLNISNDDVEKNIAVLNALQEHLKKIDIKYFSGLVLALHPFLTVTAIRKLLAFVHHVKETGQVFFIKGSLVPSYMFATSLFKPSDIDGYVICDNTKAEDQKKSVTPYDQIKAAATDMKFDCVDHLQYHSAAITGQLGQHPFEVCLAREAYKPSSEPILFLQPKLQLSADGKMVVQGDDKKLHTHFVNKIFAMDVKIIQEQRMQMTGIFCRFLKYYDKLEVGKKDGFILDNESTQLFIDSRWLKDVFFPLPNASHKIKCERIVFYYESELKKLVQAGKFNHPIARPMIETFLSVALSVLNSQVSVVAIKEKADILIRSVAAKCDPEALATSCWAILCHDVDTTELAKLLSWQPPQQQLANRP